MGNDNKETRMFVGSFIIYVIYMWVVPTEPTKFYRRYQKINKRVFNNSVFSKYPVKEDAALVMLFQEKSA